MIALSRSPWATCTLKHSRRHARLMRGPLYATWTINALTGKVGSATTDDPYAFLHVVNGQAFTPPRATHLRNEVNH
jgi:hypothetical protein